MGKYRTRRPKSDDDSDDLYWETPTIDQTLYVYEEEIGPRNTGILDAQGNPIWFYPDEKKIGFIHHE